MMIPTFAQWGGTMAAIANQREKPSSSERLTSELERFCRRPTYLGWDEGAFHAALQHDWDAGQPVEISEFDDDGRNGAIFTDDGYTGGVGTFDVQTKRHFIGYRWIAKNNGTIWRLVFGKAIDGRIVHVGKLRLYTEWAKAHGYGRRSAA